MKYFIALFFLSFASLSFAQKDAVTTLTTLLFDEEVQLDEKHKKTHSKQVLLQIPADFWNQFERIDAVFISSWTGAGEAARDHFEKDAAKIAETYSASPVIYFAEKDPGLFTYPRKQAGFGTELVLMENIADTASCLRRYCNGKISPKGIFPCMIAKNIGTTPVNFMYRYALPKHYYTTGSCPTFKLLLRSSAKADTVVLDTKIAITVQGKRQSVVKSKSMEEFLEEAMLKGMQADGFPQNHARWIAENTDVFFVGKCPICMPVERGIRKYLDSYVQKTSTVPAELLDGLALGDKEKKQKTFSNLVNRYVERYFEELAMNAREKTDMLSQLEAARKVGMERKTASFGTFCPSCDGACKKK
jgi:hypothetical protein